ncbi:MAG: VanZ family protein [Planctomycetia bacterium]|nr:VanZ family protein [Planctomycetia bacterium]
MSSTPEPVPEAPAAPAPWPSPAARRLLWLLLLVAWTVALVVPIPFRDHGKSEWVAPLFTFSKFLHVSVYALLAAAVAWLRWPTGWRLAALAVLCGHGMLTEFLQWLLEDYSHRSGKWPDVGLDVIGVALGTLLTWRRPR